MFRFVLYAIIIFAGISCTKNHESGYTINDADRTFALQAGMTNSTEIALSDLALSKSTDAVVRSYAQDMIALHTSASIDLRLIANTLGLLVKDSLDANHVQLMATLNSYSGRKFDSAYMHSQNADLKVTSNYFGNYRSFGNHVDLRAYYFKYINHIQQNLLRADSIASKKFPL